MTLPSFFTSQRGRVGVAHAGVAFLFVCSASLLKHFKCHDSLCSKVLHLFHLSEFVKSCAFAKLRKNFSINGAILIFTALRLHFFNFTNLSLEVILQRAQFVNATRLGIHSERFTFCSRRFMQMHISLLLAPND